MAFGFKSKSDKNPIKNQAIETVDDTKTQKNTEDVDDLSKDELIQRLMSLNQIDLDKLDKMAAGDVEEGSKDENLMHYLQLVSRIFGKNTVLTNDGPQDRLQRYQIYDEMEDTVAYVSSALDIMSDDATQPDSDGHVIHIKAENAKVQSILEQLFVNLEIEDKISKWARVISKYGDMFLSVQGNEEEGITHIIDTNYPGNIERKELNGELIAFVQTDESDVSKSIKAPWEYVHFRHKGDIYRKKDKTSLGVSNMNRFTLSASYGQSILQPAIRVYSQLRFVENMIILARLTNSIRRNIFLINVGDVNSDAAIETVNMYSELLKKDLTMDLDRGVYDSKKQSVKYDEDIFLPVSDTKNDVRIEQVGGDFNISEQYDLEYLINKLFASLKIPKAYLNYEQDLNARSTLVQLDIRYARSVARLQQTIISGLMRLARIQLAYKGIDPMTAEFNITLSSVSSIEAEIRRQEREQNLQNASSFFTLIKDLKSSLEEGGSDGSMDFNAPPDAAQKKDLIDMKFSTYYILKQYMDISDNDLSRMLKYDLSPYQDASESKTKNECKILKESTVHPNSDNKAPYPYATESCDPIREFAEFRTSYKDSLLNENTTEVYNNESQGNSRV